METTINSTVKTPEPESENPTRFHPSPTRNGLLKRRPHLHHPVVVTYKECLKNHAASIGGHAVDGCGEFMPSPTSNPADPTSLKCSACGCHRNFHRRDPEDPIFPSPPALEYRPHHRHHPPPPPPPLPRGGSSGSSPNNSPSPPPISSAYYTSSAPHALMALSHSKLGPRADGNPAICGAINDSSNSNSRKRFRTKFTQDQKGKMLELAERIGWKMQKRDDGVINDSCSEIGVERGVFKVWMHNNKNNLGKKDQEPNGNGNGDDAAAVNCNGLNYTGTGTATAEGKDLRLSYHHHEIRANINIHGANGSSSSPP